MLFSNAIASCTISSVSCRGIKTPSPTDKSKYLNVACPTMYCSGSRFNLRETQDLSSSSGFLRFESDCGSSDSCKSSRISVSSGFCNRTAEETSLMLQPKASQTSIFASFCANSIPTSSKMRVISRKTSSARDLSEYCCNCSETIAQITLDLNRRITRFRLFSPELRDAQPHQPEYPNR